MAMKTSGVHFRMKNFFFDRKHIQDVLGKDSAKALGKAGAHTQRRARSSLRRRKKTSAPGSPPSVHSSDTVATLKNIWFALDRQSLSVVVGPLKLNAHHLTRQGSGPSAQNILSSGSVPGVLEHGGSVGYRKVQDEDGKWVRVKLRRKAHRFVPVWKATPEERSRSQGVHTILRGKRAINFYLVENPPSRIFWHNVAARPFMGPALEAEAPNFPSLWIRRAG
jgi:hypothetical protein